MNEKRLSIIITCHNDDKYIKQSIESVVSQTNDNIEVICVDDASEDNSLILLQQYALDITLKNFQNNVGLSRARNAAVKMAHGEYIMFVDGDDFIADRCIEQLLALIYHNKHDVIMGLMEVFKDSPDVIGRWNDPIINDSSIFENKSVGEILNTMCDLKLKIAPVQKYIVRKSFIESNGLWFEDVLHEDQLWTPKMLCCAKTIKFMNYKFYYHRIRKNSLGDRFDEDVCESYFQTCKKLLEIVPKLADANKIKFLQSRCEYLLIKTNTRIYEWDKHRRESFLIRNKSSISELTQILGLQLNNFEGIK